MAVAGGQEVDKAAKLQQGLDIVFEGKIRHAGPLGMGERAA